MGQAQISSISHIIGVASHLLSVLIFVYVFDMGFKSVCYASAISFITRFFAIQVQYALSTQI
jgi:hypothetical protein